MYWDITDKCYYGKQHNKYNYEAKNYGKDRIYKTRIKLVCQHNIDMDKTKQRSDYFSVAYDNILIRK